MQIVRYNRIKEFLENYKPKEIYITSEINTSIMSKKGSAKNTKNKAKHSKLMTQKKNKLKKEAELRKTRLKEIKTNSKISTDSRNNKDL